MNIVKQTHLSFVDEELISRMVKDTILIVKKVKLQVENNFKDDFEGQVGIKVREKKGYEEVQRVRLSLNNK